MISTLAHSPSRVLDLAVTPNGLQLVAVGRGEVGIIPTAPSRGNSSHSSRSETPAANSLVMPIHEKRVSVFNIADKKLELFVSLSLFCPSLTYLVPQ